MPRVCILDKCYAHISAYGCRVIQESLADRVVLQVAQAAPQDNEIWGYNGERCEDTDLCCHQYLSLGFNPVQIWADSFSGVGKFTAVSFVSSKTVKNASE